MIRKKKYSICEFDTGKNPIIHPANFLTESLSEKCVITFFRNELEQFVAKITFPLSVILTQKYLIYLFMSM